MLHVDKLHYAGKIAELYSHVFSVLMEIKTHVSLIILIAGSNMTDPRRRGNKCLFPSMNLHGHGRVWNPSGPKYPRYMHYR